MRVEHSEIPTQPQIKEFDEHLTEGNILPDDDDLIGGLSYAPFVDEGYEMIPEIKKEVPAQDDQIATDTKGVETATSDPTSHRIDNNFSQLKGPTLDVYRDFVNGMSSSELALKYGRHRLAYARRNLLNMGYEAPEYNAKRLTPPIERINDPETQIEELRELIRDFNTVRSVLKFSSGDDPILTQLTIIQEAAWGVADPQKTAVAQAILESSGIPNMAVESYSKGRKIGTYRFTFTRTADLAVEELEKNHDIALLPVRKSA